MLLRVCLLSVVCVASGWREEAHVAFPSLSHQLTPHTLIAHPGGAWFWLNSH